MASGTWQAEIGVVKVGGNRPKSVYEIVFNEGASYLADLFQYSSAKRKRRTPAKKTIKQEHNENEQVVSKNSRGAYNCMPYGTDAAKNLGGNVA